MSHNTRDVNVGIPEAAASDQAGRREGKSYITPLVTETGFSPDFVRRFNARISAVAGSSCLVWAGWRNHAGYGMVWMPGGECARAAHRVAHRIASGRPIPDGLQVCHRCDNPPCVNPEHLFLGTAKDNYYDMVSKGRRAITSPPAGTASPLSSLSIDGVAAVWREWNAGRFQTEIARDLGVPPSAVWAVVNGARYRRESSDLGFAQPWWEPALRRVG